MKILITGGAGYLGSTIGSSLLDRGGVPVILDNLSTGRESFTRGRIFYRGDISDGALVDRIFSDHPDISATVHCAGLIVVPESVAQPLRYYRENVAKTVELLSHLVRNRCSRVLFSSTAAIYRPGPDFAVDEESPIEPTSPYAQTKAMVEEVLAGCSAAGGLRGISLRYFNPIGTDPLMRTGLQTPQPTHALGKMIEALESGSVFSITGTSWPTRDGTAIRDYLHVWDLASAHVEALARFDKILPASGRGYEVINLGSGEGTTVRELLAAFSAVTGANIPSRDCDPRPGDAVGSFARSRRAADLLGWVPAFTIADAIRHSLQWASLESKNRAADP